MGIDIEISKPDAIHQKGENIADLHNIIPLDEYRYLFIVRVAVHACQKWCLLASAIPTIGSFLKTYLSIFYDINLCLFAEILVSPGVSTDSMHIS